MSEREREALVRIEKGVNALRAEVLRAKEHQRHACLNGTLAMQVGAAATVSDLGQALALVIGCPIGSERYREVLRHGFSIAAMEAK